MSYISAQRKYNDVIVWERTDNGREMKQFPAPYYFYVKDPNGDRTTMFGDKVSRMEFDTSKEFNMARAECSSSNTEMFESDIPPELKYLSDNYYNVPAPKLNVTFLDIEVDYNEELGFSSIENPYAPINSVAYYHQWSKRMVVHAVKPDKYQGDMADLNVSEEDFIEKLRAIAPFEDDINIEVKFCKDETELLVYMLVELDDADVISGWNSDFFDVPYIGKRIERVLGKKFFNMLSFAGANAPRWRTVEVMRREMTTLDLSGRASLDYMVLFKKYEMYEQSSYKLESIADVVIVDPVTHEPTMPKLEYEGSLAKLYREDFTYFIRYNLRDTEILKGLEDRLGYVETANQMWHMSTGLPAHVTGTLKLAELATINYCHHDLGGIIVPDNHIPEEDAKIQGAFVLQPQVDMWDYIGSVDINSLYPSAIRSINISPETIIGQFAEKGTESGDDAIPPSKVLSACKEIAKGSGVKLSFTDNETGEVITRPAHVWQEVFLKAGYSVSGYGTVFNQNKEGIIPSILATWYAKRQGYQKKKAEAKKADDLDLANYYDKLQYVYKIKLNSFYGALTNKYFRFYDLRMGESTTGTGRMILMHQCAEVCNILDGEYMEPDIERPEWKTVKGERLLRWHCGYTDGWSVVYGDSVVGNTQIETIDGRVNIKDLFTDVDYIKGSKEYSNCNTSALTYIENKRTNGFRKIKYIVRHKVNKKMYRVWMGNTRYLDVTEDHSLIGYANSKHKHTGLVEVKPTELGKNNVNTLLLSSFLPQVRTDCGWQLSPEMWQLIGFVIGDGHVENKKESGVGLSLGKEDKQEIIEKLIEPLISQGWFTSYIEMKNGHDVRLCGVKGYKFLRENLYPNGIKQFPEWIYEAYPQDIANVLKGYFSADGFANKNKTIGLCSINLEFIQIANRLLMMCGIPSNYWTENSFNGKYPGTYTKRLTVYNGVKFREHIGFIQDRKNRNMVTEYSKNTQHMSTQCGFSLITPTKIEELHNFDDYVYDIEVDDTHMFYANDILVHNTDSSYFITHAETDAEGIALADRVGSICNDSFPAFMRNQFLCGEGFDQIIKTGREIVADRGIFVDKKRYIMHIIDDEGDTVDKIKVMGLDTKKTTMPKFISKQLNAFVGRLLKGEEWRSIAPDVVDLKTEIEETDDFIPYGLPKGIKGIEDYTKRYKQDPTIRLPGHVSASMLYNACLNEFGDKESIRIYSGMKIKVFYLLKPIGRFKSIALPVDIEQVPGWFQKKFVPRFDRAAHVLRLVDKPLGNIIKAVHEEVPSKQTLLIEDLFGEF